CNNSYYGENCAQHCGNCLNGSRCDLKNGSCPGGCASGFNGTYCNQTCTNGSFGQNCSAKCGHCLDGPICDNLSGKCSDGCERGYKGGTCNESMFSLHYVIAICKFRARYFVTTDICANKTFGYNCEGHCHCNYDSEQCDVISGNCSSGCANGWIGLNCSTCNVNVSTCTAGSYGHKCKDSCSGNCLNGETCHFTTGECSCGCAPGYDYTRDDHCQTACDDYSYGQNCSSRCGHCLVDAVCDRISGNCPSGGCKMGYSGSRCDQLCTDNTFGYNCEGLCHCNNISEQCNVTNGDCSSGCAIGWAGNNCSKDNNIIKPGHTDVTASISNTYSTCDAFRSIDGKILLNSSSDDIALCQRCSVAEGSRSWLQLDLAVITAVSYIRVYGRNTGN
ncbi:MEG10-like protein, partial [Mya arenaria]